MGKQLQALQDVLSQLGTSVPGQINIQKHKSFELEDKYRKAHLNRLLNKREETIATHSVHVELMDAIKIINLHVAQISDLLLESGMLTRQDIDTGREPDTSFDIYKGVSEEIDPSESQPVIEQEADYRMP